jgi:hypothetical protein
MTKPMRHERQSSLAISRIVTRRAVQVRPGSRREGAQGEGEGEQA